LTSFREARLAVALLAALLLGAGCSGGGGGGEDEDPPPPPPPISSGPALPPKSSVPRPILFIEKDPNGTAYIRVLEQVHDVFAPNQAQRIIRDQLFGPAGGSANHYDGNFTYLFANIDVVRMKFGIWLEGTNQTLIYDYTFDRWDGDDSIHGAGIKIGDGTATNGATYIQRVVANGAVPPDPTYNVSNTDFIGIEQDSGPLYFRDITGGGFGDAGIDSKSGPIYVMNATLRGGNRMIRAWGGVEYTIVNSIINASPGDFMQIWISEPTAKISHYNTLWCQNADVPSASHPNCSTTPWLIEGEDMETNEVAARIIQLTENPLPAISPFFDTEVERIVIQYSTDAGATWQDMDILNNGGPGSAPVGDPRYRIPLNLGSANYLFRARYEQNGALVGEVSAVINEDGAVVP
jgi:hypothetical protein